MEFLIRYVVFAARKEKTYLDHLTALNKNTMSSLSFLFLKLKIKKKATFPAYMLVA